MRIKPRVATTTQCRWWLVAAGGVIAACGAEPALGTTVSASGSATSDQPLDEEGSTEREGTSSAGPIGTTSRGDDTTGGTSTAESSDDSSGSTNGLELTGEDTRGGTAGKPVECDNLAPLPVEYVTVEGPSSSEDFVFDADGHLVNVDYGDLLHANYGASSTLVFPGVGSGFAAGTAMLSNGDLVFNDKDAGQTIRVGAGGVTEVLVSGLASLNGLTVDMDDIVYVAEAGAGRVLRIDPETLSVAPIADGLTNPNGLAFDRTYQHLYVGDFADGTLHQIDMASGAIVLYASNLGDQGNAHLDGVILDECGNVYVTDYGPGLIYRVNGETSELVADLPSFWIPNMHFGSGSGGWDDSRLYVMDISEDQVYELDLGVRGIPLPQL